MRAVQNQMRCEMKANNDINDIMKPDEASSFDIFEMMPRIESSSRLNESRNYCYQIVFQEIDEVYSES